MSPPTLGPDPTSPLPPHFIHPTPKQFQSTMPLLNPNQHLSPNSLTGSSPSGGKTLTSYSSAAFLLQENNSTKHIKTSNGLCSSGVAVGSSNGNFRNDIDSYLMKASITATNHHHLYSTNDKELLSGFPNTGSKLRPTGMLYHHPESVAAYSTLAAAAYPFAANFSSTAAELLVTRAPPPSLLTAATNPAAASLLPPSFAALSLPAQNVCAKCNISFRMTSDLVYHMRSHHKGDHINNDMMRRRREQDKLKCPVCSESFRERHHLTRHMTAHQDKEGDMIDETEDVQRSDAGVEPAGRRRMTSALIVAGHNATAK
ncbi:PR domain zinc finger protein 8 [Zootermopsis nevadensis]|uniref:PR domain zinc finger protein 8 n=2 Tax=Zootermopsis nevadensis TaxID=136037 RepID=A0A067RCS9_ZOONE|nr:PR domain zinc finger protein 8 [Zootermopsis nevadensis]